MTWLPLLLADSSPCLRWLVLTQLFGLPIQHPEVMELENLRLQDPLVSDLLATQQRDGSWVRGSLSPGRSGLNVHTTSLALIRLGYLGFDRSFPAVHKAAEYLFKHQQGDGSWPLTAALDGSLKKERDDERIPVGYDMIPLQTVFPVSATVMISFSIAPECLFEHLRCFGQVLSPCCGPVDESVYHAMGGRAGWL